MSELALDLFNAISEIVKLRKRIAGLEESDKRWAGNVKVCMQLIERYESDIAELEEIDKMRSESVSTLNQANANNEDEIELLEKRIAKLKAENETLKARIAELGEAQRWIPVTEGLPEVNGWYLCGMVSFLGATFTNEIYFDAVNIDPRWNNPTQDRVYCWLDGVPELPEVQE